MLVKIFSQSKENILNFLRNGDITLAVFGLGNIGLPIASIFANEGAKIIGVDTDEERVNLINDGICYIENEPELREMFKKSYEDGRISATTNTLKGVINSDVKIIVVPTLLTQNKTPDLSALINVTEYIGKGLSKNDVVILESSVPPGTTEGLVKEILEKHSGLKAGVDFGLAFSPERVMSGSIIADFTVKYPKIVGGINEKSANAVIALYKSVIKNELIKVRDAKTAEAVKLFKGVYRDVNIALANELALIAETLGLDIFEIIATANTEPFSHIHIPGAGVGGHCIPYYPYFVMYVALKAGITSPLIETARRINNGMPFHVVDLITDGLTEVGKSPETARIAIFGLTFRRDAKSCTNAPASVIIEKLTSMGADLVAYDPLLSRDEAVKFFEIEFAITPEEAVTKADCLTMITAHSNFKNLNIDDLSKRMKMPGVVVDGGNIFDPVDVIKTKLVYRGVGRNSKDFKS